MTLQPNPLFKRDAAKARLLLTFRYTYGGFQHEASCLGGVSMVIGVFLLLAALVPANVSVVKDIIYGSIFVVYGIYRLNQYRVARKQIQTANGK